MLSCIPFFLPFPLMEKPHEDPKQKQPNSRGCLSSFLGRTKKEKRFFMQQLFVSIRQRINQKKTRKSKGKASTIVRALFIYKC